jgi:ribose transport system substrate-binding protein
MQPNTRFAMPKRYIARISAALLVLAAILLLTACQQAKPAQEPLIISSATSSPTGAALNTTNKPSVAFIMKTLTNPFFVEMEKGARQAEKEYNVTLIVRTGSQETSIDQQISIVEEMIAAKVAAIVIAPGSSTELIPVLVKAQAAGIPVINVDNRLDPDLSKEKGLVGVPYISVDNEQGAYLSAHYLAEHTTRPAEVAIIEGIRDARNAQDRRAGAVRAFGEDKDIQVVASETANWKIDEAYQVAERVLVQHPNVRAIFCANDMMALGALKYLQDKGRSDVLVAGFDALDEAQAAINDGRMLVTVDQQAGQQGYLGVKYAVMAMRGEQVPAETMVDVKLVHQGE